MVCYDRTISGIWNLESGIWNLESGIWNLRVQKNLNIEKIIFKVVQIKFLAMLITNQKWRFYIFTVVNVLNMFMEHDIYLFLA